MPLSAIVYSKPGCPGCTWVKRHLTEFDVPFIEHDVTSDPAALDRLRDLYDNHRRGQQMSAPVTLLVSDEGVETIFGPDIRRHLKQHDRAAAAA
ncbi:glutaredoxin family protein [Mycobacterium sp. DSM 3803]|nr:glutaredoxin family protein [Mycobacterium sp. DSM 3803]